MNRLPYLVLVCEDAVGEAVLKRLAQELCPGLELLAVQVEGSNSRIGKNMKKYADASRAGVPHVVLTDLDNGSCAPRLLTDLGAPRIPGMLHTRIAVREVEAWLLADRHAIADHLQVAVSKVPMRPEELSDPKQELLNLIRKGRSASLKKDMLPAPGSLATKGLLYNHHLQQFVATAWDPQRAAKSADSLKRCILRMTSLES